MGLRFMLFGRRVRGGVFFIRLLKVYLRLRVRLYRLDGFLFWE